MSWLSEVIEGFSLSEETAEYLYSRGAQDEAIEAIGMRTWGALKEEPPDPLFLKRYQSRDGTWDASLRDWLVIPLRSPRGAILGFEARSIAEKRMSRYLLPEAVWNPIFMGLTPGEMAKVWAGADVWLVEGIFDVFPLHWVVPDAVVLGTGRAKLSDKHKDFLARFCRGWVNLAYDNDPTGQKGMHGWDDQETGKRHWGAKEVLDRVGVKCRVVPYRGGKDPGDIWRAGGERALAEAFQYRT